MSQNTTLAAVLAVSQSAIARDGETTILIERSEDTPGGTFGYWYDVQRPSGRVHNFCFDFEIRNPEDELAELDIDTTALTWEATDQSMDFSTCTCLDCNEFLRQHGLVPRGATPLQAFGYRLLFAGQRVAWKCYLLRLWLIERSSRIARWFSTAHEGER